MPPAHRAHGRKESPRLEEEASSRRARCCLYRVLAISPKL